MLDIINKLLAEISGIHPGGLQEHIPDIGNRLRRVCGVISLVLHFEGIRFARANWPQSLYDPDPAQFLYGIQANSSVGSRV